jgi:transcriptional regulator with XRE-family HTH domain
VADEKKNPLGPTGEHVRANVKRIREARGLSYRQLSDRLRELRRPIPTLGLSRIEKGERRVDADDLMALCAGLRVNPAALLLPPDTRGEVELTGFGVVLAREAWDWADGRIPFTAPDDDPAEVFADFQIHARPRGQRMVVHRSEGGGWSAEIPHVRGEHGGMIAVDPYESKE